MLNTSIRCPCGESCNGKRMTAVNTLLENEICTAGKLKELLLKELGEYATNQSLKFLSARQCTWVEVFTSPIDLKPMQFGRRGRVLYNKSLNHAQVGDFVLTLLTPLQRQILAKFTMQHKKLFYFSKYDLRKLTPYSGTSVEYALSKLLRIGSIQKISLEQSDFYVDPPRFFQFEKEAVMLEDKIEFAVVKRVHELIMNLYPLDLIPQYGGRIRPRTYDVLKTTGGMTFDIFYEFREPILGRSYLAIDVYTRMTVNGYMVNSFLKKIAWAKTAIKGNANLCLKDRTYGMIVFKNATRRAIDIANKNGLRFIRLSDIKIEYDSLRGEVEKELVK